MVTYLDRHYETGSGLIVPRAGANVTEPAGFTIDRPSGSGDYDFLHFATPALVRAGGELHAVKPGGCILYGPDSAQWYTGEDRAFTHDWFHCAGTRAKVLLERYDIPLDTVFYPSSTRFIRDAIEAICMEGLQQDWRWDWAIASHVELFLARLSRMLGEADQRLDRATLITRERLRRMRTEIHRDPARAWRVEEMGKECSLSRSRFSVLYKRFFGVSPMREVIDLRLRRARWLLSNSTLSIGQVAYECGFDDPAYFNRLFKSRMGCTPGVWGKDGT